MFLIQTGPVGLSSARPVVQEAICAVHVGATPAGRPLAGERTDAGGTGTCQNSKGSALSQDLTYNEHQAFRSFGTALPVENTDCLLPR